MSKDELIAHGLETIATVTAAMLSHSSGTLTDEQLAAEYMRIHADSLAHSDELHMGIVADREAQDKAAHEKFDTTDGKP